MNTGLRKIFGIRYAPHATSFFCPWKLGIFHQYGQHRILLICLVLRLWGRYNRIAKVWWWKTIGHPVETTKSKLTKWPPRMTRDPRWQWCVKPRLIFDLKIYGGRGNDPAGLRVKSSKGEIGEDVGTFEFSWMISRTYPPCCVHTATISEYGRGIVPCFACQVFKFLSR